MRAVGEYAFVQKLVRGLRVAFLHEIPCDTQQHHLYCPAQKQGDCGYYADVYDFLGQLGPSQPYKVEKTVDAVEQPYRQFVCRKLRGARRGFVYDFGRPVGYGMHRVGDHLADG